MYRYEDLSLDDLLEDPEIDPESADALYAIAQHYHTGKEVEKNEELYLDYLQRAAFAGSELAQQELAQQNKPEPAIEKNADKLDALWQKAGDARTAGNLREEFEWLRQAKEADQEAGYDLARKQTLYLRLGELYSMPEFQNLNESYRCYCMATELGSYQGALKCSEYLYQGKGCARDEKQARGMYDLAVERGPLKLKYDAAVAKLQTDPVKAEKLLRQVQEGSSSSDEALRERAALHLAALENGILPRELLTRALGQREDASIRALLEKAYEEHPDWLTGEALPFAEEMVRAGGKKRTRWLKLAAGLGSSFAQQEIEKMEQARRAEEARKAEEARRAEQARIAAEQARRAEEARRAEQARRAEEARVAAEQARRAEEVRIGAEQNRTVQKKGNIVVRILRKILSAFGGLFKNHPIIAAILVIYMISVVGGLAATGVRFSQFAWNSIAAFGQNALGQAQLSTAGGNGMISMNPFAKDEGVALIPEAGTFNTGEAYDSAVGATTGYSAVEYLLEGECDTLTGRWGIDARSINTECDSSFQVYADDRLVYQSPVITAGSTPVDVSVDLTGCNLMTIIFQDADGSAVLANPVLKNVSGVKVDQDELPEAKSGVWLSTTNLMEGSFSSGDSGHSVYKSIYYYDDEKERSATFYLGGQYESLSGVLSVSGNESSHLEILADDQIVYTSEPMVTGSAPISINLNGCEKLTIRASFGQQVENFAYTTIGIGGARLSYFPVQNENA